MSSLNLMYASSVCSVVCCVKEGVYLRKCVSTFIKSNPIFDFYAVPSFDLELQPFAEFLRQTLTSMPTSARC